MAVDSNNLSLRQLRAFVVVARCRSFTAASKELFITASALSDSVRQLEQTLGVRLFDRTTRSVEITRAGEEFLLDASQVLQTLDASITRMVEVGTAERGWVRVAGVPSIQAGITAPCAAALMDAHPGIRFTLLEDEITGIMAAVLEGEVDFGVGVVPAEALQALEATPLVADVYGVVARKDHEVLALPGLQLESLQAWNYVGVSLGADMDRRLAQVRVRSRVEVNGFASMVALLEQGAGVSILPALAARRMLTPDLAFRAFHDPAHERQVSLLARPGRSLAPAAQLLWDAMRAKAGEIGAVGRA